MVGASGFSRVTGSHPLNATKFLSFLRESLDVLSTQVQSSSSRVALGCQVRRRAAPPVTPPENKTTLLGPSEILVPWEIGLPLVGDPGV